MFYLELIDLWSHWSGRILGIFFLFTINKYQNFTSALQIFADVNILKCDVIACKKKPS